jgi:Flp pilus assembly protein TadG
LRETRRPCRRDHRARRVGRRDDGSSIVELVIVFPALLLLVMMSIEFGIWMQARHLAQAAADDGLAQTQQLNGTGALGQSEAQASLKRLGATMFTGTPSVVAARDDVAGTASVTIDATAVSVVPFFTLTVHERVSGPVERFVPAP